MKTIGVVTVGRSDYGIYTPVLNKIRSSPNLDLQLFVSGMHLSPEFGNTFKLIEADGYPIIEKVEMLLSADTPSSISKSIGLGVIGFSQAFQNHRPDILLVLGDRFEMLAAAVAALPYTIPIAHIHGGEITQGAMDEAIRHSITKMSHLHFVSTKAYRDVVIQLGEEPWRITISGAPALDHLHHLQLCSRTELESQIGIPLQPSPLLVTYHPVTLEYQNTGLQISELLTALDTIQYPIVFTYPNADTNGRLIIDAIQRFVRTHPNAQVVSNLGTQKYFSLMKLSAAMVGNSSSGIIEAASFQLPVVNIGNRQRGRIHGLNVIDTGYGHGEILQAITQALSPAFRAQLQNFQNPYGNGKAADRIVGVLENIPINQALINKSFYHISTETVE